MGVEPAVGGQQRRVDIDQLAAIARHKICGEDAHETRQHHKVWMEIIDELGKRSIETVAIRVVAMLDDGGRNSMRLRDLQSPGIRAVADDRRDAAGQPRFQQRLQVAAATGNEDDDVFHLEETGSGEWGGGVAVFPLSTFHSLLSFVPHCRCAHGSCR